MTDIKELNDKELEDSILKHKSIISQIEHEIKRRKNLQHQEKYKNIIGKYFYNEIYNVIYKVLDIKENQELQYECRSIHYYTNLGINMVQKSFLMKYEVSTDYRNNFDDCIEITENEVNAIIENWKKDTDFIKFH